MPQNVCEITTLDLSHVVPVKSTVEISQNFVAFLEYMNFKNENAVWPNNINWVYDIWMISDKTCPNVHQVAMK